MADNVTINSNYSGEVLGALLVKATTGNDLVAKGIIRLEEGINFKFHIPRLRGGKFLRKVVEQPEDKHSKGGFKYDERTLEPQEFMAFTTFNPKSFERLWRKWQPEGDLVFRELPPEGQNALLAELAKCVDFELGGHFVNGVFVDDENDDDHLFNGILSRIFSDPEVIYAHDTKGTMIDRFKAVRKATPEAIRTHPKLRYLVSVNDADKYDDELTERKSKGANWTETNPLRYKSTTIVPISGWPDGLIVATLCGMDLDTNLWAAVNLSSDANVIQIDKLTNSGERYFFKMKMKADTNTAWGDQIVVLDAREAAEATLTGSTIHVPAYVSGIDVDPAADVSYNVKGDDVLLGATLSVTNESVDHTVTIDDAEIGPAETAILRFDGKNWFCSATI